MHFLRIPGQWHPFFLSRIITLLLMVLTFSGQADADQEGYLLQTSLWTTHFNARPYHNNQQRLLGVERFGSNIATRSVQQHTGLFRNAAPLAGATVFRNSFDQSTGYLYIGFRQPLMGDHQVGLYTKLTGGVMHGYRGEHRDKIPFNRFGTSLVAIPAVGVQVQRFTAETVLFGAAGVMLNVGYRF